MSRSISRLLTVGHPCRSQREPLLDLIPSSGVRGTRSGRLSINLRGKAWDGEPSHSGRPDMTAWRTATIAAVARRDEIWTVCAWR